MNKETIKEGNSLISLFDGFYPEVFNYYEDANILMSVVSKIGALGYRVTIDTSFTRIHKGIPIEYRNLQGELTTTFLAVTDFIKWHNAHLMQLYNKAWSDEMQDLPKTIDTSNSLEFYAYEHGVLDALAGDDVSSVDLQSTEDILLKIYKRNNALLNHKP